MIRVTEDAMSAANMRVVSIAVGGTPDEPMVVAVDHCGGTWFTGRTYPRKGDPYWAPWEQLPPIVGEAKPLPPVDPALLERIIR